MSHVACTTKLVKFYNEFVWEIQLLLYLVPQGLINIDKDETLVPAERVYSTTSKRFLGACILYLKMQEINMMGSLNT